MPPAGFETAIPASGRPQTLALDRSATAIGSHCNLTSLIFAFPLVFFRIFFPEVLYFIIRYSQQMSSPFYSSFFYCCYDIWFYVRSMQFIIISNPPAILIFRDREMLCDNRHSELWDLFHAFLKERLQNFEKSYQVSHVCLSISIEQLCSHWTGFDEI